MTGTQSIGGREVTRNRKEKPQSEEWELVEGGYKKKWRRGEMYQFNGLMRREPCPLV